MRSFSLEVFAGTADLIWLLAQLKPNCASIAEKNLRQQGFQTFLPMEKVTKRRKNRFIDTLSPFLPGYIFVALEQRTGGWRAINSTVGVTRLVSFGDEPTRVPQELMHQMFQRFDGGGGFFPPEPLKFGDKVRLTTGPFASAIAEIESYTPKRRVWVLLDLLDQKTRVCVDRNSLRVV